MKKLLFTILSALSIMGCTKDKYISPDANIANINFTLSATANYTIKYTRSADTANIYLSSNKVCYLGIPGDNKKMYPGYDLQPKKGDVLEIIFPLYQATGNSIDRVDSPITIHGQFYVNHESIIIDEPATMITKEGNNKVIRFTIK